MQEGPSIPDDRPLVLSDRLRMRVADGGRVKVDVTMEATAAARLASLVPGHLRDKLHRHSIDIDRLVRQVVAGGYQPGDLFRLDDGIETVRVWLE